MTTTMQFNDTTTTSTCINLVSDRHWLQTSWD